MSTNTIYDLIVSGVSTPRDLIKASDYNQARIHTALRELEDAGRIRRVGHGRYTTAA